MLCKEMSEIKTIPVCMWTNIPKSIIFHFIEIQDFNSLTDITSLHFYQDMPERSQQCQAVKQFHHMILFGLFFKIV